MTRILWIDDQPIRYQPLRNWATYNDVEIIFAHGFDQINYYLRSSDISWDAVILDHDMPMMDGKAVIKEFFPEMLNIPVFLCSANDSGREYQKKMLEEFGVERVDGMNIINPAFNIKLHEFLFSEEDQ